jgi:hypothetical protein
MHRYPVCRRRAEHANFSYKFRRSQPPFLRQRRFSRCGKTASGGGDDRLSTFVDFSSFLEEEKTHIQIVPVEFWTLPAGKCDTGGRESRQ